jgi:hypothetical protein
MRTTAQCINFRVWNYETYSVVEVINAISGRVLSSKTHPDVPDLSLADVYENPFLWADIKDEWTIKEM